MTLKRTSQTLRHGLYSSQLTAKQRLGLKKMPWDDTRHEVILHRAVGAGLFRLLQALLADERPDVEQVVKLVGSLGYNTAQVNTSVRTYALRKGRPPARDALHAALQGVPFELAPADEPSAPAQLSLWPEPDPTAEDGES